MIKLSTIRVSLDILFIVHFEEKNDSNIFPCIKQFGSRISNRIYPFPVTNNRDNINARNFSLFRLIHEKPIRFPDPPPCVFFKHSVHRFANFAPGGFRPMKFHLEFQYRRVYRGSTLKTPRALSGITLRIRLSLFPLYTYPLVPLHFPPFIPFGS